MRPPRQAVKLRLPKTQTFLQGGKQQRFSSHGAHDGGAKESFGIGLYLTLGAIPLTYITYKLSRGDADNQPYLTRLIHKYDHWTDTWYARNALHTQMVEKAGEDRLLFLNSRAAEQAPVVNLKYQDVFNHGSPYNVPAGQGSINLDKVVAHYNQQNAEQELERVEKAKKDGRL